MILIITFILPVIIFADTSVSHNGITWTFDGDYQVGRFVMGDPWVVGPVTIVSVSPAWNGERNGSMINPSSAVEAQGYRHDLDCPFREELRVDFPLELSAEITSLISTEGLEQVEQTGAHSGIRKAAILTVVASPPPSDAFRPPYVSGEKPIYTVSQMNFDLLPRLETSGTVPVADFQESMIWPWIDHSRGGGNRGATLHPVENMPPYGRWMADEVSHVGLMALLNIPEANELAIRLTQVGIDFYHNWLSNVGSIHGGGFGHGRKWPILFAGIMLNNSDMKNPPLYNPENSRLYKFVEDRYTSYGASTAEYPNRKPIWGVDCENGDRGPCRDPNGLVDATSNYRACCSVLTWVGQALAARIMNAIELWNHNVFFDYVDRWVTEPESWREGGDPAVWGFGSRFIQNLWETYRGVEIRENDPPSTPSGMRVKNTP